MILILLRGDKKFMQKKIKVGEVEIIHFFKPGKTLNDISLKKLHRGLIQISEGAILPQKNKLLDKNLTLNEIREYLKDTVLAFGMMDKVPCSFLIYPMSKEKSVYEIKTDHYFISSNQGENFSKMMVYGNLLHLYERVGTFMSYGKFSLESANLGKINWYKYMQIKLQYFLLKKDFKKAAAERDVECETIKMIISYKRNNSEEKCV